MLAMCLQCRALYHSSVHRHARAVKDYEEQLGLAESIHGEHSLQVCCINIGEMKILVIQLVTN